MGAEDGSHTGTGADGSDRGGSDRATVGSEDGGSAAAGAAAAAAAAEPAAGAASWKGDRQLVSHNKHTHANGKQVALVPLDRRYVKAWI